MPAIFPLLHALTHILDQNNTKDVKNIGVNNGYVTHSSILNHHFNSLKTLCSSYESLSTAIRKKKKDSLNILRRKKPNVGSWAQSSWAAGEQSTYWFYSIRFSDR